LLEGIITRQAELIAQWQLVGFIHGVMNTDNMTISGETIDYGPCAFMDLYDPATVFSSIDRYGRYAYGNQPSIGGWNLARLVESLLPLLHADEAEALEIANTAIKQYNPLFQQHWLAGMRAKLGLFNEEVEDEALITELLNTMKQYRADYTNTFLALTFDKLTGMSIFATREFKNWHQRWLDRLQRQEQSWEASQELMRNTNPAIIPRNHRVEEALEAAVEKDDYSVMERLLQVLADPFAHTDEQAEYATIKLSATPYVTYCGT